MTTQNSLVDVFYPESDGQPMAETDLHRDWMFRIIELLRHRYRGQQVYISGNLLMYYVEGNPRKSVSPDGMVVKGIDPGRRRIYKTWKEGKVPDVVFETTSESTEVNDTEIKFELCARLGIPEYFLFDPTRDYLDPPLRGYRLTAAGYIPIEFDANGRLSCEQLDLWVELNSDDELVLRDRRSGSILLTAEEAACEANIRTAAERDNVAAKLETSEAQRRKAEERSRQLEAEIARLKAIQIDNS